MTVKAKWKLAAVIFAAAATYLQWTLWFGDKSLVTLSQTRAALTVEQSENERRKTQNDDLAAEINDLKFGEEAMEERARMELGLVKEGETFYKIIDTAPDRK